MTNARGDDAAAPLPRDWLPDATAPADASEWQPRLKRIITAVAPPLPSPGLTETTELWPIALGAWWKPASAMAAAALALIVLLGPPSAGGADQDALSLTVIAGQGEPFAIWLGLGLDADPVLALIALQEPAP